MSRASRLILAIPPWVLTGLTSALTIWLTLVPQPIPKELDVPLFPEIDKVVHVIMTASITVSIYLDLMRQGRRHYLKRLRPRTIWIVAAIVTAFGGMIELAQLWWIDKRGAEWGDFAGDAIGALAAALIFLFYGRR